MKEYETDSSSRKVLDLDTCWLFFSQSPDYTNTILHFYWYWWYAAQLIRCGYILKPKWPTGSDGKEKLTCSCLAEWQQCETTRPPLLCFGFVLWVSRAVSSHRLSQTLNCCCCEISLKLFAAPDCSQFVQETINLTFTDTAVKYTYRGLIRSVINDFDYLQSEFTLSLFWNKNIPAVGASSRAATNVFDKLIIFPINHLVYTMSKKFSQQVPRVQSDVFKGLETQRHSLICDIKQRPAANPHIGECLTIGEAA